MAKLHITVPHTCITTQDEDPGCDKNADLFGDDLGWRLGAHVLKGDTFRSKCDLNRVRCRNYAMRVECTGRLRSGLVSALLDVHTFQYNSFPGIKDKSFVVMAGSQASVPAAQRLYDIMLEKGLLTGWGRSPVNDIVTEAAENNCPAALLEIRDDLRLSALPIVAQAAREWVRLVT